MPDVVVIGAGIVGAACAYYAARAGLSVTVLDRGSVAGGTTGAGEGNVLVSDKAPGPELELALLSARLWEELAADLGDVFEYELKGGLIVAENDKVQASLEALAVRQRGVRAEPVGTDELRGLEPLLAEGFAGGVFYPQDAQVQPMLAAAHLLEAARERYGSALRTGEPVIGLDVLGDRIVAVRTPHGEVRAGAVVNAAGTWSGEVAALARLDLPILPRRGFILVTEPLPALVRHKVYTAEYVANVASDSAGLETSAVVEGTPSGTILIGASRERTGFDRTPSMPVLGRLASQAIALFPVLADARAIRTYCGFRPYCPDHLPVIGAHPRVRNLYHACGHEGAGIGLAPATGSLIAGLLEGKEPGANLAPFRADRFEVAA